ncbi:UbiA prenyltransferase family protein [Candidatus Woesearchaeota archaeon]|nr:UbiA prenyltransferase family protein [Candidatus Woesearchaeota archaeon]
MIEKTVSLARLCRPQQWYKNLVVYLALIFTVQLFAWEKLFLVTMGFISLSLISSANYIINDIADRGKDRKHPEKKLRPIASGKVQPWEGTLLAAGLILLGGYIAYNLGTGFSIAAGALFVLTQLYSFSLKNAVFVDVLSIAVNFVVRAVAGALIIGVRISPWLILCTFFLSLFLSAGKRASEVRFLGKKAGSDRKVNGAYTKEITDMLMMVTTTLLIISYSLYSFLSDFSWLLVTIPFALYTILRYTYLTHKGSVIARRPELALMDWKMMAGVVLWTVTVVAVLQMS